MILRTPPQRKRKTESPAISDHHTPVSDRRLILYDHPLPISSLDPSSSAAAVDDGLVCAYQCRQMVKSEFVVALNTAEKQVVEYKSRVDTLSNELVKTEGERDNYREKLHYAEQELEAAKGRERTLQEQLLKEVAESRERYQAQLKRCYELEAQIKKEVDSRKNAELSATEAKEKTAALEGELQRLSESTRREKNSLQKELLHLKDDSELSISRITADLERTRLKAYNFEKETELLKDQLKELQGKLNECLRQKSELEHKASTSTASSHESSLSESPTVVKHLLEELRNYEVEVHEARKLKSSHLNKELLKEKLREEKNRRERAEMELSELQKVQHDAQKLQCELACWKSLLKDIPDVSCYEDIPKKIANLQHEAIESMRMVGEINVRLKELEVALESSELSRQHAEKESALDKVKVDNLMLEVKRLEQMLGSNTITKEIGWLKKDCATCNMQKTGSSASEVEKIRCVQDLENALCQKESAMKELEASLHKQREVISQQHHELKLMNERLSVEARRVKSLERENDNLHAEIALLESKLGHGDYSASSTKVLRMVNTLGIDNEAKHTIESLRAELQRAQAKLQAVEELKGQSDVGKIIDADIPEKLAELKKQIAILEKREGRYKAVFQEKISVFRKACCLLFGYEIKMDDQQRPNGIPVTRFTLQSIYAQNDDEKLEFDYESSSMSILVNDYSSQPEISRQVDMFIRRMQSIPAFTANLTMESFNKRTLS